MRSVKIGFVGYSGRPFDKDKAREIISNIFDEIRNLYKGNVEIVTGATNLGIPALVYEEAVKQGYPTTGIMCKEGYTCELFPCDKIFAIGENWGDESETFIHYIDILYRIGGGKQSLDEVEKAKSLGKVVTEFELEELKSE